MKVKKLLASLLAVAMVLGMMGFPVIAEEAETADAEYAETIPATDITEEADDSVVMMFSGADSEINITWDTAEDPDGAKTAEQLRTALASYKDGVYETRTINLDIGEGNTLNYAVGKSDAYNNYLNTINPGITLNIKSGTLDFVKPWPDKAQPSLYRLNICGVVNIESGAKVQYFIEMNLYQNSSLEGFETPAVNVKSGAFLEEYGPYGTSLCPTSIFNGGILNVEEGAEASIVSLKDSSRHYSDDYTVYFNVAGKLNVQKGVTIAGDSIISGELLLEKENYGSITNRDLMTIADSGKVIATEDFKNSGSLIIEKNGSLCLTSEYSMITNSGNGTQIINRGNIEAGMMSNTQTLVENDGTINLSGCSDESALWQNSGKFYNAGKLILGTGLEIVAAGVLENTVDAVMTITSGIIDNSGTLTFPPNFTAPKGSVNKGTIFVLGDNAEYPFGEFEGETTVTNSGRTGFALTIASALTGAGDGDTIRLVKDCTVKSRATVTAKNTVLDLNGKTLIMKNLNMNIVDGGSLTVKDTADGGTVRGYFANVEEFSSLTIEAGTFTGMEDGTIPDYNFTTEGYYTGSGDSPASTLIINGCDFTAAKGLVSIEYWVNVHIADSVVFRNKDTEEFQNNPIFVERGNPTDVRNISLAEGKELVRTYNAETGFYEFTQEEIQPDAKIGDTSYATLHSAFDAAADNDTITLTEDYIAMDTTVLPAGKTVVLDVNGHTGRCLGGTNIAVGEGSVLTI